MAWGFRAIIGVATLVGLPAAGYMMNRVLAKSDQTVDIINSHDTSLKLLIQGNSEIKEKITGVKESLQDHEIRIRSLERSPR